MGLQSGFLQSRGEDAKPFAGFEKNIALRIESCASTRVSHAIAVLAEHIDSDNETRVLNRPSLEQRTPSLAPHRGPVGGQQQQIVLVASVAQPSREAQILADRQVDAPTPAIDRHAPRSGVLALVLAGHSEPIAPVVSDDGAQTKRLKHLPSYSLLGVWAAKGTMTYTQVPKRP